MVASPLTRVHRMRAMFELSLINEPEETVYSHLTELAGDAVRAPIAMLTLMQDDFSFFRNAVGLPDSYNKLHNTRITQRLSKEVVRDMTPLIINDVRDYEMVQHQQLENDLSVQSYLGMPLILADGECIGSFAVIDVQPRRWNLLDKAIVEEVADVVALKFNARAQVVQGMMTRDDLATFRHGIVKFAESITIRSEPAATLADIRNKRGRFHLNSI